MKRETYIAPEMGAYNMEPTSMFAGSSTENWGEADGGRVIERRGQWGDLWAETEE